MWIDDQLLTRCHEDLALSIWVPRSPIVVLGSSNKPEQEADTQACERDGIAILRRYGGGGTVLLHSGCVVVSIGAWVRHAYQNKLYFDLFNRTIIMALEQLWPEIKGLSQRGLSDIALGERKVAGTSLFRSRNYALYQASLLVDLQLPSIDLYLRHPSREPDYRGGRSHAEFLMGLSEIVEGLTAETVALGFEVEVERVLQRIGKDEMMGAQPDQFAHLLQRATGAFS